MHSTVQLTSAITPTGRSLLRRGILVLGIALACLTVSPPSRAQCNDGCSGDNTFLGEEALLNNTSGNANTAIGAFTLVNNTTGGANTATGVDALVSNTAGSNNTANGTNALLQNTTGNENTAIGVLALSGNSTGNDNTAIGLAALANNTIGNANTATGAAALQNNSGFNNAADGFQALQYNTTGNYNTASGQGSLLNNTTGHNNTAAGQNALRSNTIGSGNIALGSNAGGNLTTGSNNIDIFDRGVAGESNTIRIGRKGTQSATYVAGIRGATVAGGVGVIVDLNGHLGTVTSSERYKHAIRPMDKASEAILALKPVTFRYKHELDPAGIPQFGLVAEQVEKVSPDLVARDDQGKPYSVRYEAVNAMLLNEFLKEHRKVEEQQVTIAEMKCKLAEQEAILTEQQTDFRSTISKQNGKIEALTASLREQASAIQKVSDGLKLNRPSPQMVTNNP